MVNPFPDNWHEIYRSETFQHLRDFQEHGMVPLYGFSEYAVNLRTKRIPEVAASGLPVLVCGETGTGKELVAQTIRLTNEVPDSKFTLVHCDSIPKDRCETELFGQFIRKPSGPPELRHGKFAQAHDGAVLLKNIDALPAEVLSRLPRLLRRREVHPVNSPQPIQVKTHVIATTSKPEMLPNSLLPHFIERINLEPLRHRPQDVLAIAYGVLKRDLPEATWTFPPLSLIALMFSPWEDNAWEVMNAIERSVTWYNRKNPAQDGRIRFCYDIPKRISPALNNPNYLLKIWKHVAKRVRELPGGSEIIPEEMAGDSSWSSMVLQGHLEVEGHPEAPHPTLSFEEVIQLMLFIRDHCGDFSEEGPRNTKGGMVERLNDAFDYFLMDWALPPEFLAQYDAVMGTSFSSEETVTQTAPDDNRQGKPKNREQVKKDTTPALDFECWLRSKHFLLGKARKAVHLA